MQFTTLEEKFASSNEHFRNRKHDKSLDLADELHGLFPENPILCYSRARNLAALNKIDDAQAMCEAALSSADGLQLRIKSLGALLDPPQQTALRQAATEQRGNFTSLRSTLENRLADALDKVELQRSVAELQNWKSLNPKPAA